MPISTKSHTTRWLMLAGLVVLLDQLSKWAISQHLTLHQAVPICPFFSLYLTHNTGAGFSLLSQAAGWQRWFFIGISGVIMLAIIVWLRRIPRHTVMLPLALSLILGGALGNVWDRIQLGYVVDFLLLYWHQWQWPVFNVADSAICIGVGLLCLQLYKKQR